MPRKGQKISESTRKKLENSGTWFKKGHPSPNKGKKMPEKTKNKISKTLTGKFAGDKHPMWGKKHSEESKGKMKGRKKNKQLSETGSACYPSHNNKNSRKLHI